MSPSKRSSSSKQLETTKPVSTHVSRTVSPFFLIASLLIGVPLAYHGGIMLQRDVLSHQASFFPESDHQNVTTLSTTISTRMEDLLNAATYKRIVLTNNSQQKSAECKEVTVEEITFSKPFGQYDGHHEESSLAAHVIMDIERLDSAFLQDVDRVRTAIFDTIWEASLHHDLAITAVHCQNKDDQTGIVCSVTLEHGNHMTVMTDPVAKVCSLDLSFVTQRHLLHVVPIMEKYFGIGDKPLMRFRQIFRGQRVFSGRWETLDNDITELLLEFKNDFFFKKEIGSLTSNFQQIDIWEGLNPKLQSVEGYERSLLGAEGVDDYYTQHPELFRPNRMLYMDGVMQSSSWGDEAYHEGLVHPAMFAHAEGPKRVAIIGGGEGATLREILKHKSVEVCTMIEIDPGIVEASRVYLPRMNDCSDFGRGNCFDEGRTELRLEDAFGFFLNRFKKEGTVAEELKTDPYGVIVMDALDPDDTIEFAVQMYKDTVFWGTLHEALTDNGILMVQLGMTADMKAYGEQFGVFKNRDNLFRSIEIAGFERMFIYHDTHSDFKFPWSYLIACKSADCEKEWYRNEAEINLRMHERILPSKSGQPMLKYFDGATMQSYLRPYTSWQNVHCRKDPLPEECSLFETTKNALAWDDVFDFVSDANGENFMLVAKMDAAEGTPLYKSSSSVSLSAPFSLVKEGVNGALAKFDGDALSKPSCGVTRKLSNLDLSGQISPLQDRQPHIFEMTALTKDVQQGEQFSC